MSIIDDIMKMSFADLSKFTKSPEDMATLRNFYRAARRSVSSTKGAFTRANEFSYALEKYLREHPKVRDVDSMSYYALISEIAAFKNFKAGETSTLAGARRVYAEQDKRIFGVDSNGRPLGSMNRFEREEFWEVYEEWEKMYHKFNPDLSSSQVQMNLADLMFNSPLAFGSSLFTEKLNMLQELSRTQKNEFDRTGFMPNVLSGRGNVF